MFFPTVRAGRLAVFGSFLVIGLAGCGGGGGDHHDTGGVVVETLAGGFGIGDGGAATATAVNPQDVAVDGRGDVFVVDVNSIVGHWLVRRVDARTGVITTIGGPCEPWVYSEPPQTLCDLQSFTAIGVRSPRELFVETQDQQMFRVDIDSGALERVAGTLASDCREVSTGPALERCIGSASGMTFDEAGNLYLAEPEIGVVRRLDPQLQSIEVVTRGLPAADITIDGAGTLYVVNRERKGIDAIDPATGSVTPIAGTAGACDGDRGDGGPPRDACFVFPTAVAARPDGTLFVADVDRLRRIDATTGIVDTVATAIVFDRLAVAPNGDVIFVEDPGRRVARLDVETRRTTTVAGNGTRTLCTVAGTGEVCIGFPNGVAPGPAGSVYFADGANQRIARRDAAGDITTVVDHAHAGSCGDTGPELDYCLADPTAVVRDRDGTLYFADRGAYPIEGFSTYPGRIRRFDPATGVVTTIAGNCTQTDSTDARAACVPGPSSLVLDGRGGLYVGDGSGVQRIELANGTIRHVVGGRHRADDCNADGIAAVDACVDGRGLAIDTDGNLYALAFDQLRVRRIDAATGIITTIAGTGTLVADDGTAADCGADGGPATRACLLAYALAVEDGRLVVAANGKIRLVDLATGIIDTPAGFPEVCSVGILSACVYPADLTFDDEGRLLAADPVTRSIRRITLP